MENNSFSELDLNLIQMSTYMAARADVDFDHPQGAASLDQAFEKIRMFVEQEKQAERARVRAAVEGLRRGGDWPKRDAYEEAEDERVGYNEAIDDVLKLLEEVE